MQNLAPEKQPLEPRRLELALNPTDGSLQSAPLSHVLLAATDALYNDLSQMTDGEMEVAATQATEDDNNEAAAEEVTHKRERMSNLSFAQRRHELGWRLARHSKSLQHVAALTAAAATSDLGAVVDVSSSALQHARTAWVQADEAQDAMYFFHAQLFPGRSAPHDILGAADVQLNGMWYDMPRDMQLQADPFETSKEASWNRAELDDVWQMAVRRKLLTGEAGYFTEPKLWNVAIRGGLVRMTCGKPHFMAGKDHYPIAAVLTVLPSGAANQEWTLLSLDIHVQAKTGEFNYQLECSNRQKYDLHRLAALAMSRAEAKHRLQQTDSLGTVEDSKPSAVEEESKDQPSGKEINVAPPRPLDALFQVAHTFSLSWQLEVLSAQALGLRRGVWGSVKTPIQVTPVKFVESSPMLGALAIQFWKVDDSFGPPAVGDLTRDKIENDSEDQDSQKRPDFLPTVTSQFVLSIRAEAAVGMIMSLSGGGEMLTELKSNNRVEHNVEELLEATSNPFALSASDALLAAARLCAHRKCSAVVESLKNSSIPDWIRLSLSHGCIEVGARTSYYCGEGRQPAGSQGCSFLFRIQCDLRTGSFVPTFPRSFNLLRSMAGTDSHYDASESMAVRVASLPQNRRRAAGANSTGRCVREAFDGLMRSMNLLSQRTGVGGKWDDSDPVQSPKLRHRSIQVAFPDVQASLIKCCAMATLYGLAPMAVRVGFGMDAAPDMAGGPLTDSVPNLKMLAVPPLSIRLNQEVIESSSTSSDGVTKKDSYLQEVFFSMTCTFSESGVCVVPLEISLKRDTPAAIPEVTNTELLEFESLSSTTSDRCSSTDGQETNQDPSFEASKFADLILALFSDEKTS